MTKIAYDAKRLVRNTTGLGNYSRTLVNDLSRTLPEACEMLLYTPSYGRDNLREQVNMSQRMRYVYPKSAKSGIAQAIWRSWGIVSDLKKEGVSLYHGLSGELPIGIRKSGIKSVVTIHDLIFMRHPEYYNPIDVMMYRAKFHLTCREADRIIAISRRTAEDIVELGGVDPKRIDIIYQSCGVRFANVVSEEAADETRRRYNLPERFVLNVGTIEERKNVLLAVKALKYLSEDIHLVVVGRRTKYADKVEKWAEKNNVAHRLHMLSGVENNALHAIYQLAESFVYPSRYEGFGIPIIEAIQSRLPVVAATGSCLEEAGGPDCLYVSPDSPEECAEAIKLTLRGAEQRDLRIMRSREYVKRFENKDTAKQVMEVYRKLVNL